MAHLSAANYLNSTIGVQNISKNPANLVGVFISSMTGTGTIAIFDDAGATGTGLTLVSAFTPAPPSIMWYPIPAMTRNGIAVSIAAAATLSYTFFWD